MVPKGTLRAPVSPFKTTVWRYGDSGHGETCGVGETRTKTEVVRRRGRGVRRGGEQTDNHRRPQATLIRMQTSVCHIYFNCLQTVLTSKSVSAICLSFSYPALEAFHVAYFRSQVTFPSNLILQFFKSICRSPKVF